MPIPGLISCAGVTGAMGSAISLQSGSQPYPKGR